jgi:ribosomal protein S3AE
MRDQNINLTFQVDTVKENTGHTKLVKYAMMPSIIKRFVRRDKSKIADSFIARDKNNTPIRLKPLVITFRNATRSQKTAIRLMTRDFIKTYISKITFDNFVKDLLSYTFQKKLKASIKKIMPIRFSDIRIVEYANVKGIVRKKVKVEEEIPEEEVSEEAPTEEVEEKVEKETPVEKETKKSKEEAKESVEEKTEEPEAESKEETSEEKPKKD